MDHWTIPHVARKHGRQFGLLRALQDPQQKDNHHQQEEADGLREDSTKRGEEKRAKCHEMANHIIVSLYHYVIISLYHYIVVSLYHCIIISFYHYIIISLYHCIIISYIISSKVALCHLRFKGRYRMLK